MAAGEIKELTDAGYIATTATLIVHSALSHNVVTNDDGTDSRKRQSQVEIERVIDLIGIDEDQIEWCGPVFDQFFKGLDSSANLH
jgi:hypothetical protein